MKKLTQAEYLPIEKLKPFEGHPFYVKDDDEMEQLTESIRQHGVLNPIMVRPLDTGEYEVTSLQATNCDSHNTACQRVDSP